MSLQLEVGARGWEHPGWMGGFYPDTLPEEWRLTYYSNEFRCVLVPGEYWRIRDPAEIGRWRADVHENFTFYLEIPVPASGDCSGPPGLLSRAQSLEGRIGGVLLRLNPGDLPQAPVFAETLAQLVGLYPLYVDVPGELPGAYGRLIEQAGAGLCWRPAGTEPRSDCRIGLLAPGDARGDLRELRHTIQAFLDQRTADADRVLLFEGDSPSVQAMKDAAVIASLLGT